VLAIPQMHYWENKYGDILSHSDINQLFNRYAHIQVSPTVYKPTLLQADAVVLPLKDFTLYKENNISISQSDIQATTKGGFVDRMNVENNSLEITGWALWSTSYSKVRYLNVSCNTHLPDIEVNSINRPDVAIAMSDSGLFHSGFKLTATVAVKEKEPLVCRLFSKTEKSSWVELHHAN